MDRSKNFVSLLKKKDYLIRNLHYRSLFFQLNFTIVKLNLQSFFLQTRLKFIPRQSYFFIKKRKIQFFYYKKIFVQILRWSTISFAILIVSSFLFGFFAQLKSKYPSKTIYLTTASPRHRTLPIAALSYNRFLLSSFSNPGLRSIYKDNSNSFSSNICQAQRTLGLNRPSIRSSFDTDKETANNLQNNFEFRSPGRLKERAKIIALCTVAYYCGHISGSHMPTIIHAVTTLLGSMSNVESLYNLTKQVNTPQRELQIKEKKLTMDVITEEKLTQLDRLNNIEGDTSLRVNIRSAHTSDFTSYGQKEAATLYRLDMMMQLFEDRKIEIYKHCFERGLAQPISNLYIATAYLSWWYSEYPLRTSSDLFIQSFLCKIALITKKVSNNIEEEIKLEQHFEKVKTDFIVLQVIGKAICSFRKQIIILKCQIPSLKYHLPSNKVSPADRLSNDLKQKLIFESFREGFRQVSEKSTLISYDHQEIAKLIEELLQTYFID